MRDVVKECYENCEVGAVGFIKPDPARGDTLERFQADLLAAQVMHDNGQIFIQQTHHESQTGHKYIDFIKFLRLK